MRGEERGGEEKGGQRSAEEKRGMEWRGVERSKVGTGVELRGGKEDERREILCALEEGEEVKRKRKGPGRRNERREGE